MPIAVRFRFMEKVDKIRQLFLREARSLEKRALESEGPEQDELLDVTVSLRILAELRRFKSVH
jgi:hypothetical protein